MLSAAKTRKEFVCWIGKKIIRTVSVAKKRFPFFIGWSDRTIQVLLGWCWIGRASLSPSPALQTSQHRNTCQISCDTAIAFSILQILDKIIQQLSVIYFISDLTSSNRRNWTFKKLLKILWLMTPSVFRSLRYFVIDVESDPHSGNHRNC